MIRILHLADLHIGSGFTHGKINPETGLNTRLEDFSRSLGLCIDRAIALPVDLVLFAGDAFPDATPEPYVQKAFAQQFKRLADAQIPTILLAGNHDQHAQGNGGTSLSIYRTLEIPGLIVAEKITTHCISTSQGEVQVITIPWLTNAILFTRSETEGLSAWEVDQKMIQRLTEVLEGEIRKLDPSLPTVLLAHLMADRANVGGERFLAVAKVFTIPISLLLRPEIDYIALGHVHKHQNLNPHNNPPAIYPGSIERVDFSEEKEEKGYVLVELARGEAKWEFCPLPARPFRTIEVDVSKSPEPEQKLLSAIAKYNITDTVVRLVYKMRREQIEEISTGKIAKALQSAHQFTICPELVSPSTLPRIPEFKISNSLDPLQALTTYIDKCEHLQDIATEMIEAAKLLLNGDFEEITVSKKRKQLKLL
ncbi:exonuclease subunit SbcD [Gloeocapsa sp. PCC 73106]|uniref:exonuclease subunit SbcD n=1 Tax=Gloeocapsa sp. PCC 73106 TaxID=102232 RepID=UPI0002ABA05B|nr:exonuclease subunit SbcD [Gloeocapsa sp. PCC 73106]ELR96745.1 Exodeoxyribonuclease I subunit D [Gloeocapsa sp. PCC 73106]